MPANINQYPPFQWGTTYNGHQYDPYGVAASQQQMRDALGPQPAGNPNMPAATGQGINSSIQGRGIGGPDNSQNIPANEGLRRQERNSTVAGGGRGAVDMLLRENGTNPFMSTPMTSLYQKNSDQLSQAAMIRQIQNPSLSAEDAMQQVVQEAMQGKNVLYSGDAGQNIYNQMSQYLQSAQQAGGPLDSTARLAFNNFFGSDPQSVQNLAGLLYGTTYGARGKALQQGLGEQAQEGSYRMSHPDQYNVDPNSLSWIDMFNRSSRR